jgi:hypothetical protein
VFYSLALPPALWTAAAREAQKKSGEENAVFIEMQQLLF